VILVNGRRLPETLQQETGFLGPPDVNFIPLSLIQQVEVLPVSASAMYNGNAVGGVINIVLRPAVDTTEVTLTYTNALRNFDAPQSTLAFQHGRTLLGGKLRLRLNATWFQRVPPVETELGFLQRRTAVDPGINPHRATPNVRSASGDPLFGPGSANFTSVTPGATGTGTLADFAGRQGVQSLDLFDSPGGAATSPASIDYAYGRQQRRSTYYGSVVYEVRPWLELGLDGLTSLTVVNRGYNIFATDLAVSAASAFNPFHQDLQVALNETPALLGQKYSEAHLKMSSLVFGALLKLPLEWRVNLDSQYSWSTADYRGLAGVDQARWQELVDQGKYNPLRDTQRVGPPRDFYDRVLVYNGGRDQFVTFSDYDTLDAALRITNQSLDLPTGRGAVNLGGDYRRNHLAGFNDVRRYGDGTLAGTPDVWTGRTLQRYSAFGELQAPLLPSRWLPGWLHNLDADLAVRYVAADTSNETNVAPTIALKADFAGGWALRGSFTTSNRFPTPHMSRQFFAPGGPGGGDETTFIYDPLRNENYNVTTALPLNPSLNIETAATQTAGVIFQRGKVHRVRASLDFVDTQKTNELLYLDAQAAINVEAIYPGRVVRQSPNPSEPAKPGRITNVYTGSVNAASRHSQNLNLSVDYQWKTRLGGTLDLYGRWVYIQRYDRQLLPGSPRVDEVGHPDGTTAGLLRHRVNLGASWTTARVGFGLDGHYYGARILPETEWASQGSKQINPYWQFDGFLQSDLHRWLPWKSNRVGLRAQLRVNNLFYSGFPKYANDGSGAGVQPYGDWRGRTYSLSLTATF
jgi:outer membrane receptor protein involved in Fe transport